MAHICYNCGVDGQIQIFDHDNFFAFLEHYILHKIVYIYAALDYSGKCAKIMSVA